MPIVIKQQDELGFDKALIPFYTTPIRTIKYPFGAGYESLLLSTLKADDHPITFSFINNDTIQESAILNSSDRFIVNDWYSRDIQDFEYFYQMDSATGFLKDYEPFYPQFSE